MLQIFSQRILMLAEVGEGSGQPTDPQYTSTSAQLSIEEPITVLSSSQLKKTYKPRKAKRTTKISQSSGPIHLVANETVYKETQSMATLNEPLPQGTGSGSGPRVNTLGSGEDSMKLKELMELFTKLSDIMKKIEQTVKTSQARRRIKIIASNDEEDLVVDDPSEQGRSIIEEMDLDAEIKLLPRDILGEETPLFSTVLVIDQTGQGEGSAIPAGS
ncbi:hypothetical protein Tco_0599220 [Tanacetum coccineum]